MIGSTGIPAFVTLSPRSSVKMISIYFMLIQWIIFLSNQCNAFNFTSSQNIQLSQWQHQVYSIWMENSDGVNTPYAVYVEGSPSVTGIVATVAEIHLSNGTVSPRFTITLGVGCVSGECCIGKTLESEFLYSCTVQGE